MKTILCINAHPLPETDTSRSNQMLTYAKKLLREEPVQIEELSLYQMELPRVEPLLMEAWSEAKSFHPLTPEQKRQFTIQQNLLTQWKKADAYIISMPLHNFNVPSRLKDYFDNVLIAGETFRYTETGSEGLLPANRKALLLQASGSVFTKGGPNEAIDFAPQYVEAIFRFMGIENFAAVRAEGTAIPVIDQEAMMAEALQQVAEEIATLVE